jgi:hypothetical protein
MERPLRSGKLKKCEMPHHTKHFTITNTKSMKMYLKNIKLTLNKLKSNETSNKNSKKIAPGGSRTHAVRVTITLP